MTDLELRLDAHHRRLVEQFAGEARQLLPAATTLRAGRRISRRLRATAAVAVAAAAGLLTVRLVPSGNTASVTVQLPGLTVVSAADRQATPRLTASQAEAIALTGLTSHFSPSISGYTVTAARFIPDVLRISQQCGAHIAIPERHDLWVVAYTAPPQGRWQFIRAAILVDDANGGLLGGQILEGPRVSGPLATCHWGT
jgi:hypothetical protein